MSTNSFADLRLSRRAHGDAVRLAEALRALERRGPDPREEFRPPRPARTALAAAGCVLVPVMLGVLSWRVAALAATPLLALAIVRTGAVWYDLCTSQSLGDRLLRSHPAGPLSPLAAWRAEELTSKRTRRRFQRLTRGRMRELEASLDSPVSPLEQAAAWDAIVLLRRLDARLGNAAKPGRTSREGAFSPASRTGGLTGSMQGGAPKLAARRSAGASA
jgi:hypothetical protein